MPNMGDTSENGLLGITQANAASKLYATFVGIGVDFNAIGRRYYQNSWGQLLFCTFQPRIF